MRRSRSGSALTWWGAIRGRREADPRNTQRAPWKRREHGSRRKPKAGFHRLPHSLGNLAKSAKFPLSHRADDGFFCPKERKGQNKNLTSGGRRKGRIALLCKADRSLIIKTAQVDLLTT